MRIQASAGPNRKKDLRDYCHKLTLTVANNDPVEADAEGELFSRIYQQTRLENGSYNLLRYLRRQQKPKVKN